MNGCCRYEGLTEGPQSRAQPSLMGISTTVTFGTSSKAALAPAADCISRKPVSAPVASHAWSCALNLLPCVLDLLQIQRTSRHTCWHAACIKLQSLNNIHRLELQQALQKVCAQLLQRLMRDTTKTPHATDDLQTGTSWYSPLDWPS